MNVLFVHQNFPAQFGHIAARLVAEFGYKCSFVSLRPAKTVSGVRLIQYRPVGGATRHTHYCSRTFENCVAHAHGVYEALRKEPDVRPDLIVAHSGFGSSLFLSNLYNCPIINYFEYYYAVPGTDLDFRPEFPTAPVDRLRAKARNAMILLDLQNCTAAYSPTRWQAGLFPEEYQRKLRVIFDGVDTKIFRPRTDARSRLLASLNLPADAKIVTYVSRNFESMRGFDIFMEVASRIAARVPEAVFLVVGRDGEGYGGDRKHIQAKTFREHILSRASYPLERFRFLGTVPPPTLATMLAASDLHLYFTVPFVLSWSLINAMACGCRIVASDTAPVKEVIRHGYNGLLADFYDVDALAEYGREVLEHPGRYARLGDEALRTVLQNYSLDACLPMLAGFYRSVGETKARKQYVEQSSKIQ